MLKNSLSGFYNAIYKDRGFSIAPHHIHVCLALEDFRINKLILIGPPGTGKSTITSQVYPAWRLGEQPDTTIIAISAGEGLVKGFQEAIGEIIETDKAFRKLYPEVTPDKKRGWSTEKGLYVTGHAAGDPDASFIGVGIDSRTLTGLHGREIIMDDLHNKDNSASAEQCQKVVDTFYNTILGRADPRGARYVLSGRRFNRADVYGALIESGDWVVLECPAERKGSHELWHDVKVPKLEDGSPMPCWFSENLTPLPGQDPDKPYVKYKAYYGVDHTGKGFYWPGSKSKRSEFESIKRATPALAEAVYQCNPNVRENPVFEDADFITFRDVSPADAALGIHSPAVRGFIERTQGTVIQVWDTAAGKSSDSAYSVCVTGILVPSDQWWRGEDEKVVGQCERHNRVYVVDVLREKLDFGELSNAFRKQNGLWQPQLVLVENRSSGIQLLQSFISSGIPIRGVTAKDGKMDRAVDAVGGSHASVQGWFRQHRVVLLDGAAWGKAYTTEFLEFSGTRAGRKDQVDATVYLIAHAIEAGVGMARLPSSDALAAASPDEIEEGRPVNVLEEIAKLGSDLSEHPLYNACGTCEMWHGHGKPGQPGVRNWCGLHKRAAIPFDSCWDYRERGALQMLGRGF
jgi:predicted phage terminase large subunit-like protein